jgi:hypothetical protein
VYVKDGVSGTNGVDNIIPPHQGFFVHCSAATGTLGVDNGARIHASKEILKESVATGPMLKFIISGNNYSDEILVQVDPLATIQFDNQYDGLKYRGGEAAPQLYSLSKDNEKLSINAFPESEEYNIIPIGLEVGSDGIYTMSFDGLSSFSAGADIYLEDLKEGTMTKLEENSPFSLTANSSDDPLRFLLHLKGALAVPENLSADQIDVYSFEQDVYITSENVLNGVVIIYDITGRAIVRENLDNISMKKINLNGHQGYMVVRLISDNGSVNQKVFIK